MKKARDGPAAAAAAAAPKFEDELYKQYADTSGTITLEGLERVSKDLGLNIQSDVSGIVYL